MMASSSSLLQSLHYLQRSYSESLQSSHHHRARGFLGERFLNLSSQWRVYKSDAPFKRRVTCIEWHPTHTNAVAFSSKAGDILLWKYDELGNDFTSDPNTLIKGIGYGYGSVSSMKFHPKNPNCIYTTSIDGTFRLQDFTGKHSNVFLDTQNYHFWWVSFDYCLDYNLLFVGGNTGKGALLSTDGKVIKEFKKLHKSKIKHAQFCHAQSSILTTSSVDRTVQIWDVRMLREDQLGTSVKPLSTLKHNAPVSSSHFDPFSGTRLLTTSQNGELRVYDSFNMWTEPTVTIEHAHKHFQHLTDITATWHPLYDNVCVIGRYPRTSADKQIRGVDLISLDSGKKAGHIYSPHVTGIMSVNKFNRTGEVLASGEGCRILVWKLPSGLEFKRQVNGSDSTSVPGLSGEASTGARRKRKREPSKDNTAVKKLKQKMACEAVTVTTIRKRKK